MLKIGLILLALIGLVGTTTHYALAANNMPQPLCSETPPGTGSSDTTPSPGGPSDSGSANAGSSGETITIPYTTQHDTGLSYWWHHFHPFGGHQPIKGGFFHRYYGHNNPYTDPSHNIPWWNLPRWYAEGAPGY